MIPDRQPVADLFCGIVLKIQDSHLLTQEPLPDYEVITSGQLTLRYALSYLGKPHLAIVPGLVALDYGEMLTGEEAWDFLLHRSNLHPRADVLGFRNDGVDDMIVVKLLDLVQPVRVLTYPDSVSTMPSAQLTALIAPESADIPPRLLEYLPQYPSIKDWQASTHE